MTVKCKHCGEEFESKRKLHPHENFHCKKRPAPAAADDADKCEESDDGKHDWKLMRKGQRKDFDAAIAAGYKLVCYQCGELK